MNPFELELAQEMDITNEELSQLKGEEIVVTNHQPSSLDIQGLLTSRDAILPEAFQTVSQPEPRPPLTKDEAIKFGLVHNTQGDKFFTQLGYAYAIASSRQRTMLEFAFQPEFNSAELLGQTLWQEG